MMHSSVKVCRVISNNFLCTNHVLGLSNINALGAL